jgi:hypothetical protein
MSRSLRGRGRKKVSLWEATGTGCGQLCLATGTPERGGADLSVGLGRAAALPRPIGRSASDFRFFCLEPSKS